MRKENAYGDCWKCKTEVTLTNTKTGKEYMSDKEADHDVDNPNSVTQRKDIRRDVKVIVPRLVLGSATLKKWNLRVERKYNLMN